MTINELLVKRLSVSYEKALELLNEKLIIINDLPARQKQLVLDTDEVRCSDKVIQPARNYRYILYYKPRGIECTMNPDIGNNLLQSFPICEGLFPVGRLDKESEGLLLMTDDGSLYKKIAGAEQHQEKEYEVTVDTNISQEALEQLTEGVEIMGQITRHAKVNRLSENSFTITLTQGLNRQIRRMCYKLGYNVVSLKRIRIASLNLGDLSPGEYRQVQREEILIF